MSFSIPNSIIEWANSQHTASGASSLLSKDLVTQLKTYIGAESKSIHNDDLLNIILDTVKDPKWRNELSTSGRSALALAITDLKQQCKKDIEKSPPQGFFAKVTLIARGGNKAIDVIGDKITHKLAKADASRLLQLIEYSFAATHEGELLGLIKDVLPFMPKSQRQEACRKIAINRCAEDIFRKSDDLQLVKALAKELYKTGMLYSACRMLDPTYGLKSEVQRAIIDTIKEEMSIRPKWSLGQYFSAGPSHSIHIPAQISRDNKATGDNNLLVDNLIVTAAKEKAKERFVFFRGSEQFEEQFIAKIGNNKPFAISFSENRENIIPQEVVKATKMCNEMFVRLNRYLPREGTHRTVDRLSKELTELFQKDPTGSNLATIQKKLEHLVQNSKLRPDIIHNILRDASLKDSSIVSNPYYTDTSSELIASRTAKKNNEDYIQHLIHAHESFEELLRMYPKYFKDIRLVSTYDKRISQIDSADQYTIEV